MYKSIMENQPIPISVGVFSLILNLFYFFKVNFFLQEYDIKSFNHFIKAVPRIVQNNDVERLALLTFIGSVVVIGLLVATWNCMIRPILDSIFENSILWWLTIVIYIINAMMTVLLFKAVLLLWILLIICGIYSAANSDYIS